LNQQKKNQIKFKSHIFLTFACYFKPVPKIKERRSSSEEKNINSRARHYDALIVDFGFCSFMRDVISKLKDIQNTEQNSTSEVLLPSLTTQDSLKALPTVDEVKAELGDNAKDQLAQLQSDTANSTDPAAFLKLAIANELIGDNNAAITSLQSAIQLAPTEKDLYIELVALNQKVESGKISVFINGEKINFKDGDSEVDPVIIDGTTLIPIRKITEKLGAKVDWNSTTVTANIRLLDTDLQLIQDSTAALVNGNPVPPLKVPAKNINGHIEIPLRFISEQLNKDVDYIPGDKGTAIITILDKSQASTN
jgi:hypothetical protein